MWFSGDRQAHISSRTSTDEIPEEGYPKGTYPSFSPLLDTSLI